MLAALTMQSAHDQDETARAQRDQAMKAEVAADNAEIQDMHEKADLQRVQGVVDGVCDFAQAGTDVAQGASTLQATEDRIAADNDDGGSHPKGTADSNGLRTAAAKDDATASEFKAGGEALNGVKSIVHGALDGAMTDKDADAKAHDASAQMFKQIADDAHSNENDAKDLLNKALDFYKEYTETRNQTLLAASHRA